MTTGIEVVLFIEFERLQNGNLYPDVNDGIGEGVIEVCETILWGIFDRKDFGSVPWHELGIKKSAKLARKLQIIEGKWAT